MQSGSARTLYLDDELWKRLLQLVKLGYARNASQLMATSTGALIELSESLGLDIQELSNHQIK